MHLSIQFFTIFALAIFPFQQKITSGIQEQTDNREHVVIDFKNVDSTSNWFIINDDVMGGVSRSRISLSDSGTAIFQGTVSLKNNGGFASTRTRPVEYELGGFEGFLAHIKGDGKRYQFRIRTDNRFDSVSYRYQFETHSDKWMTIRVPFSECIPVFRGRILKDIPPISSDLIQQIGFMIADKQAGEFRLEIEWIKAYSSHIDPSKKSSHPE